MTMTREMQEAWLSAYIELQKTIEYWYDKEEAAEEKGNIGMAERYNKRGEEYEFKAEGMLIALGCFGYTVQRQYNRVLKAVEFVIVEI